MKTYLYNLWERTRTSYWFLPGLMLVLAIILSVITLKIDETLRPQWGEQLAWIYTADPEGARALLSTVAGSMITVAAMVFSITVVVLTLASNQFGPRLIRNFIRDTGNQVVLGTFVATFLYCLLILRRVVTMSSDSVPQLSITCGVVLAIASLIVLIYFIHHVAASIQAGTVIDGVSRELHEAIDRMFPDELGASVDGPQHPTDPLPPGFSDRARVILAQDNGYIQAIDQQRLIALAERERLICHLPHRPGRYLVADTPLALIWPGMQLHERVANEVNQAVILGSQPTPEQDVEFAVRQLVEIALRALSPGINDPFTAITCIDHLGAALGKLARRELPSPYHYDQTHTLRLVTHPVTFADVLDAAFNQIRQQAGDHVAVTIRLLETIGTVATLVRREEDRQALLSHADMIVRACLAQHRESEDCQAVTERYAQAVQSLYGARTS